MPLDVVIVIGVDSTGGLKFHTVLYLLAHGHFPGRAGTIAKKTHLCESF